MPNPLQFLKIAVFLELYASDSLHTPVFKIIVRRLGGVSYDSWKRNKTSFLTMMDPATTTFNGLVILKKDRYLQLSGSLSWILYMRTGGRAYSLYDENILVWWL